MKRVLGSAAACGKTAGILAPIEADVHRHMDMGSDIGMFRAGTKRLRELLRRYVAREARA